jgi:hypothetical protein
VIRICIQEIRACKINAGITGKKSKDMYERVRAGDARDQEKDEGLEKRVRDRGGTSRMRTSRR